MTTNSTHATPVQPNTIVMNPLSATPPSDRVSTSWNATALPTCMCCHLTGTYERQCEVHVMPRVVCDTGKTTISPVYLYTFQVFLSRAMRYYLRRERLDNGDDDNTDLAVDSLSASRISSLGSLLIPHFIGSGRDSLDWILDPRLA